LTAPTRRHDAAAPVASFLSKRAHGPWQEAIKIRQEWLDHGLSTQPADRQTAEHSLTMIYASISRPRPRFEWVSSPQQALPLVAGWPTLDALYALIRDPRPHGKPPLASDLAMSLSHLRGALSSGVAHPDDALHRLGLARYQPADLDHLGYWAALARSCGWWWPGEGVCVVVDRPEVARTEPVPGTWHDEVRLRPDGLRYRDGWHPLLR
jgi:hypothetical protein